jgi:cysteine-rich repeat protein
MRWLLILLAGGACVDSSSVDCGNGFLCPSRTQCVIVTSPDETLCVDPDQTTVCAGLAEHHRCTTSAIQNGRCTSGACLAIECGNGRVDAVDPTDPEDADGEVCDDGNQTPGDGCSADCASDETCGNGMVDLVKQEVCDDGNHASHDGCSSRCQPEHAAWTRLRPSPPQGRTKTAAAYDTVHHEVVLFGGYITFETNETVLFDGRSWAFLQPLQSPPERQHHAMAFDIARGRAVMFGGDSDASSVNDTWEWDGRQWSPIAATVAPAPRVGHAMAYDPIRERVVLFGGRPTEQATTATRDFTDTWLFDGTTWTQQVTAQWPGGPGVPTFGRSDAAMTFDPQRGTIVLFGGTTQTSTGIVEDDTVWELDASGWKPRAVATPRPPVRSGATLTWDIAGQQLLLVGGNDPTDVAINDAWGLTAAGWISRTAPSQARAFHVAVSDPDRHEVILFGGTSDDVALAWDGSAWSQRVTEVPSAGPYIGALDPLRERTVLVNKASETWTLEDLGFHQGPAAPLAYDAPMIAYDRARGVCLATDLATTTNVTAVFGATSWTTPSPATPLPGTRDPGLASDGSGHVVAFGGSDPSGTALDETWLWDGTTWSEASPAHHPSARTAPSMAYDQAHDRVVVFGGRDANGPLADTWTWDGSDWTQLPGGSPSARSSAGLAWQPARRNLLLYGGRGTSITSGETWEFDGAQWSLIIPAQAFDGTPVPLEKPVVVAQPERAAIRVFDGLDRNGFAQGALWQLRWEGDDLDDDCKNNLDLDGDGLSGCADPDCQYACAPLCAPGSTIAACLATGPGCGDGTCSALETCRLCPADCGACTATCGDRICELPESTASCPGDCL